MIPRPSRFIVAALFFNLFSIPFYSYAQDQKPNQDVSLKKMDSDIAQLQSLVEGVKALKSPRTEGSQSAPPAETPASLPVQSSLDLDIQIAQNKILRQEKAELEMKLKNFEKQAMGRGLLDRQAEGERANLTQEALSLKQANAGLTQQLGIVKSTNADLEVRVKELEKKIQYNEKFLSEAELSQKNLQGLERKLEVALKENAMLKDANAELKKPAAPNKFMTESFDELKKKHDKLSDDILILQKKNSEVEKTRMKDDYMRLKELFDEKTREVDTLNVRVQDTVKTSEQKIAALETQNAEFKKQNEGLNQNLSGKGVLQDALSAKEKENEGLAQRIAALEKAKAELENERADFRAKNTQSEVSLGKISQQIQDLEAKSGVLEKAKAEAEARYEKVQAANEVLRSDLEVLQKKQGEVAQQGDAVSSENTVLKQDKQQLQDKVAELISAMAGMKKQNDTLNQNVADKAMLQDALVSRQKEIESLTQRIAVLEDSKGKLEEANNKLVEEGATVKAKSTQSEVSLVKIAKQIQDLETKAGDLEKAKSAVQEQYQKAQETNDALRAELEAFSKKQGLAKEQGDTVVSENLVLKRDKQELQDKVSQLSLLNTQLSAKAEEATRSGQRNAEGAQKSEQELRARLKELDKDVGFLKKEKETLNQKVDKAQNTVVGLNTSLESLRKEKAALEQNNQALSQKVEKTQSSIVVLNGTLEALQKDKAGFKQEADTLRQENKNAQAANAELNKSLEVVRNEKTAIEKDSAVLSRKFEEGQNNIAGLKTTVDSLSKDKKSLEQANNDARQEAQNTQNTIAHLNSALDALSKEKAGLKQEVDDLRQEVKDGKVASAGLHKSLDALNKEKTALKQENDTLRQENKNAQTTNVGLNNALDALNKEKAGLKQESDTLRLKFKKLQSASADMNSKFDNLSNEKARIKQENDGLLQEIKNVRSTISNLNNAQTALNNERAALKQKNDELFKEAEAARAAQEAQIVSLKKEYEGASQQKLSETTKLQDELKRQSDAALFENAALKQKNQALEVTVSELSALNAQLKAEAEKFSREHQQELASQQSALEELKSGLVAASRERDTLREESENGRSVKAENAKLALEVQELSVSVSRLENQFSQAREIIKECALIDQECRQPQN